MADGAPHRRQWQEMAHAGAQEEFGATVEGHAQSGDNGVHLLLRRHGKLDEETRNPDSIREKPRGGVVRLTGIRGKRCKKGANLRTHLRGVHSGEAVGAETLVRQLLEVDSKQLENRQEDGAARKPLLRILDTIRADSGREGVQGGSGQQTEGVGAHVQPPVSEEGVPFHGGALREECREAQHS